MMILFVVIFVIVFVIIIIARKSSYSSEPFYSPEPKAKGSRGEMIVAKILGDTIVGEQYVINDLLFQTESGKTCQIDHIFINKFGIWVIETKNYSGTIYGNENQREWIQILAHGNVRNKFYNPLKQNTTHIYHLSQYLKIKNVFQNIVVFLRADTSNITAHNVYSVLELPAVKHQSTAVLLSVEQMEYYYNRLLALKNNATISKDEHIENIHKMQEQIRQGICPRCGGNLELRDGENGLFLGCSNYPKCKFTKGIE